MAVARHEARWIARIRREGDSFKPREPEEKAQRAKYRSVRKVRRWMWAHWTPRPDVRFTPDEMSEAGVHISRLPFFVDEEPNADLQFFKPMTAEAMDVMFAACVGLKPIVHRDLPLSSEKHPMLMAKCQAGLFSDLLHKHRRGRSMRERSSLQHSYLLTENWPWSDKGRSYWHWRVIITWEYTIDNDLSDWGKYDRADEPPHVVSLVAQGFPLLDKVSLPELHYSLHLITERLREPSWCDHKYHPVLLFIFDGTHLRLTQTHFDGHHIHMRRTDPVPFSYEPEDLAALKMAFRWLLSDTASTKLGSIVEQDEDSGSFEGT